MDMIFRIIVKILEIEGNISWHIASVIMFTNIYLPIDVSECNVKLADVLFLLDSVYQLGKAERNKTYSKSYNLHTMIKSDCLINDKCTTEVLSTPYSLTFSYNA